jgi:hypothetical protein
MSRPQDPNRNNRGVLKASPYNNSGVLVGDTRHTVIVSGDNVAQARKYAHTLGTTSLHEALSVLVNKESTKEENEKALGDLILLRLILSGKIQFKQRKLFGLVNRAITKSFKPLPTDSRMKKMIEKLVDELDSGKNDISIFRHFLKKIIAVFGISVLISSLGNVAHFLAIDSIEMQSALDSAGQFLRRKGWANAWVAQVNKDDLLDSSFVERYPDFQVYADRIRGVREAAFQTVLSSPTVILPLIIGVLAAARYTQEQVAIQDNIISKGIVVLIDNFIGTNHILLRLLLENADGESLVPTPLKGDPVGMALFFQYIKDIDKFTKKDINSRRNRNDKELGVETMNMGSFLEHGEGETCPICTAPLIDLSDHEKAVTVCENKHKCHKDCISTWIRAKDKREEVAQCPMCNSPILPTLMNDVLQRGGRGTRRRRIKRRLHSRRTISRKSMR